MKSAGRGLIGAVAVTVIFTCVGSAAPAEPDRPNVLLIMSDDQGWGDLRSHGNPKIDTPVLDRLAGEGARCERFFVSPVCAPTRASLLTGRYHLRTGVTWVTRGLETMKDGETTLAEILTAAGYATGCFGKWHNGAHFPHDPNGQGFEEFFGFCAGHWNNYFDTTLQHNAAMVGTQGYITDVLTEAAIRFIERHRDRPFFCYVAYNAPHGPFQVPDRFYDKYIRRGLDPQTAAIYGMCESVDDNVGRLLDLLVRHRLEKNTLVIFLTDNGPNSERYNGGMKGRKGSVHEGGVRVPCFVRLPGRIAPGRSIQPIAAHIDILPTVLDLCGLAVPTNLDGKSLVPLLEGNAPDWPDRLLFTHQSRLGEAKPFPGSVRSQQYRLANLGKGYELYDMIADPGQSRDLARERPEVVARLRAAYESWFDEAVRGVAGRLPIPVGHPERPDVELPAPEAYLAGKLRYKGRAGWANDSIVAWTAPDERIEWDLDVRSGGHYQVRLLYSCPESDVGATIRAGAGTAAVAGRLLRPHDPPPIPSPDRVPRGEVYEKVWAELSLGTLVLEPGRVRLRLAAQPTAGRPVCELKAVRLVKE